VLPPRQGGLKRNCVQMKSNERYLKLKEVQDLFGVSRSTVWRWQAEHGLKIVRVAGVVRIRESCLLAFLERHESGRLADGPPQAAKK
jgi:excisionase family DNA binding protein